jgi:hypothetical protein
MKVVMSEMTLLKEGRGSVSRPPRRQHQRCKLMETYKILLMSEARMSRQSWASRWTAIRPRRT